MGRALPSGRGGICPPAPSRRSAGRPPTYSGVPAAGPRVDGGAPRSPLGPPAVPESLLVTRDCGRRGWTVQPLPCKAKVDAFAWRSSPNKRQDGIRDPPPAGYLFLTCGNLLAGSLLSSHPGLCTEQLQFIFRPASSPVSFAATRCPPVVFFHLTEQTQGQLLTLTMNPGLQGRSPTADSLISPVSWPSRHKKCSHQHFCSIPLPDPNFPQSLDVANPKHRCPVPF